MKSDKNHELYSFFKDVKLDPKTIDNITAVFQDKSKEIKAAISQVKILVLGGHDKEKILNEIKDKLELNNCYARFVKDFDTRDKGIPDNLSSALAIRESNIILAIDCKRPGFATECQIISEDLKAQNKTVLFALKSQLKYKDLPALTDYRAYFPNIQICDSLEDLVERAAYIGLHLARRKAMEAATTNKKKA